MNDVLLRVRPGLVRDAGALRAIRLEALADSPDAFGDTYAECAAWSEETWAHHAATWNFYLAESDGRVVGMVRGEPHESRGDTRYLFALYVSPEARGGETATLLVDAVSAWARAQGVHELRLYVSRGVPRARAFYVKCGFESTGSNLSMHRDESLVCEEMRRELDTFNFRVCRVEPELLHDLRRRVLRDDDATVDVRNPYDALASTVHYGGFFGNRAVVSASFYAQPVPTSPEQPAYQLRYMATDFDVQSQGLGAQLLAYAFEDLAAQGIDRLWANARTSAVSFYERTGWSVVPDSLFLSAETGIDHVVILRAL